MGDAALMPRSPARPQWGHAVATITLMVMVAGWCTEVTTAAPLQQPSVAEKAWAEDTAFFDLGSINPADLAVAEARLGIKSHHAPAKLAGTTKFGLYSKLAGIQLRAAYQNKAASAAINSYSKKSQAAIRIARSSMNARLNTLGNVIASNARKVESGFEVLTGVIRSHRAAGAVDRKLIREQTKAMGKDMQKSIARSIMIGEAKARRVADRARGNLARAKRAMLIEISERVEHTADKLFKTIQGSHQKIADNYLSPKAYAVTAGGKLKDYIVKGKGKNLSSLGDLLTTVSGLSAIQAVKAEGIGMGASTIPAIFSAKKVKVKAMLTKINGLVNEYTGVINAVRARWPMGLGKYLLLKLEESMLTKGVLQVDKVSNHAGNWVFLNGRAVGLSNKLNDFESLAVRMGHYEATLAKLTAALAGKKHKPAGKKPYSVPAPEWPGN